MKHVSLLPFLRGSPNPKDVMPGCANYDHTYGKCVFGENCRVQQGKRCRYFENAVLPTAMELGLPNIYATYERLTGAPPLQRPQARLCPDCGRPLRPQQTYCEKCAQLHRRQAYRRRRDSNPKDRIVSLENDREHFGVDLDTLPGRNDTG